MENKTDFPQLNDPTKDPLFRGIVYVDEPYRPTHEKSPDKVWYLVIGIIVGAMVMLLGFTI